MPDREKVIKALKCYMSMRRGEKIVCKAEYCPYWSEDDVTGFSLCNNYQIEVDALELLEARLPRVMTIDEIKEALDDGSVVWVDFTDGRLLPMILEDGCLIRWRYIWRICDDAFYDDDYRARAWTSRPTDEQREVTPWN